jgi:MYXO-CTERM domain-containing protein
MFAAAAVVVSGSFVPTASAKPHSITPPWWTWWNLPGLCAHAVSDPSADPVLAQAIGRDDHQRDATLHVSVYSTVSVDKPQFVSCAFVDGDGNGVLSRNERLTGHVVHATPIGANGFEYDRQLVADPQASVCVVTAVFEHKGEATLLSSEIGCVVNPAPMVPEAPAPVLLGVVGVGVLGGFGLVRRRRTRQAVS